MKHPFSETVLTQQPLSLDTICYEPTLLDKVAACLRHPLGRDYPGKHWEGMRRKSDGYVRRMARYVEDDGNHFFSSDDREYYEPTRTQVMALDDVDGLKTQRDPKEPTQRVVRLGWRRLTPKAQRPGRDRRARLRAERLAA